MGLTALLQLGYSRDSGVNCTATVGVFEGQSSRLILCVCVCACVRVFMSHHVTSAEVC